MRDKNTFRIDWKFSAEDVVWHVEKIVDDLPVTFFETGEVYGDLMDVVEVGEEPYFFHADCS